MGYFWRRILAISLILGFVLSGLSWGLPTQFSFATAYALSSEFSSDLVQTKTLTLADEAIAVDVPGNWRPNPKENIFGDDHPVDKDYIARRDFLGSAMRVERFDELPTGLMPKDIYLQEINHITEALKGSSELVELEAIETLPDKQITSSTYVIKVGGLMSFHYKVALIEFTEASDYFLVMVQGGAPRNWDIANETLMDINRSATLLAAN